jgi:two-component sensor histidine kinase
LREEIASLRRLVGNRVMDADRDDAVREAVEQEARRGGRDLAEMTARLDALIRSSSEVRYLINADWSELAQLSGGGFIPDTSEDNVDWLDDYIPEEHRGLVRTEIERAIEAKDTYHLEHKVNRVDGSIGWALSRAVPLFDENGEIKSWMGAASDITARKTAEETQQVLTQELSHRIKNILSVVQSIATQTLRTASSTEEARKVLEARLNSLARAQDIVTQDRYAETEVRTLVDAALAPYQDAAERISMDGSRIKLPAQQALGLSLALHELATNAAKYGSLSNDAGTVSISWDFVDDAFVFDWLEIGAPPVTSPARRGFGSRLIEQVVPSYFNGKGRIDFQSEGIRFRLVGAASGIEMSD